MAEPLETFPSEDGNERAKYLRQVTDTVSVWAYEPTEAQMAVLYKAAAAAKRNIRAGGITALDLTFRVIEKLLVDEADVEVLDSGLIEGTITMADIVKIFGTGESDDKPAVKTRTRRGR
jgi:hypothetical protein